MLTGNACVRATIVVRPLGQTNIAGRGTAGAFSGRILSMDAAVADRWGSFLRRKK
jgi:hypothetical protein